MRRNLRVLHTQADELSQSKRFRDNVARLGELARVLVAANCNWE